MRRPRLGILKTNNCCKIAISLSDPARIYDFRNCKATATVNNCQFATWLRALHPRNRRCSIKQMVKARPIVVLALLALWTAVPVLACLPTHQMTQAEMACCKKMVGDCQMGSEQHPCCKTAPTINATAATIATVAPIAQFHPSVAVVSFTPSAPFEPGTEGELAHAHLGLPPPAPPGPSSILRI